MRQRRIFEAVIILILMASPFHFVEAANVNEKESLRGLSGIVLKPLAFVSTPTQIQDELPLWDLSKEIESQLRQSGLLLAEHMDGQSYGRPVLEIQGAVTQIAANYYAYTVLIELHQEATLMSHSIHPSVVTWSEGTLSTGDIQNFQDRVRLLVRMFIQDFQQMNASPSPAWSLSWVPSDS
ncbi:MAG: hypothetical protein O2999_06520 [Nitrospirae bacterium]|nr:hypothetical protein [Nitrospirota bacterium]MDA1303937.1 hypothetical protein [Nitrospirota bacterium]